MWKGGGEKSEGRRERRREKIEQTWSPVGHSSQGAAVGAGNGDALRKRRRRGTDPGCGGWSDFTEEVTLELKLQSLRRGQ